jgi:CBS domain-containing protein
MITDITTVLPSTKVIEVSRLMLEKHIKCVLVCNDDRNLDGIVKDSDIVFGTAGKANALQAPISELMTKNPVTVDPDIDIFDVVAIMGDRGFRRIPVVKDGRVVGIMSIRDIVRYILKNIQEQSTD